MDSQTGNIIHAGEFLRDSLLKSLPCLKLN
jgi:hypothetical protein